MDRIQLDIIKNTEVFRTSPKYQTYPPYHIGPYLEELFFKIFTDSKINNKKYYLPIFWTTVYNDKIGGLQKYLNSLNPNYEYFTVCQHDDAVKEKLPNNTIVYSAGGNRGDIPIPLVCSKLSEEYIIECDKNILASFVGSITHNVRRDLYSTYLNDADFSFKIKNWSPVINRSEFELFINETKRSKFTLCPRGYGKTSFRLYESLQLNSVPVYISDYFWLPFSDEIDWNSFCVIVNSKEISDLKNILLSIDDDRYTKMLHNGKRVWKEYFEINKVCEKILFNL